MRNLFKTDKIASLQRDVANLKRLLVEAEAELAKARQDSLDSLDITMRWKRHYNDAVKQVNMQRVEIDRLAKELKLERNLGIEVVHDAVAPHLVTISKLEAELSYAQQAMKEHAAESVRLEAERDRLRSEYNRRLLDENALVLNLRKALENVLNSGLLEGHWAYVAQARCALAGGGGERESR